ncbi:MAG: hypothetical protein CVV52_07560 [Spirochaetae bacterium HGW-Spirochaetae-8]|nr:MAG: hypothetical protein CVV52_07560 [Spirochaetae bacterium HGW-Spirochaetae-8]
MRNMTVAEAASAWNVSERRVRLLCSAGRIDGATKLGWAWSIPSQTKPGDARALRHLKNRTLRTGAQSFQALDKLKSELDSVSAATETKVCKSAANHVDNLLLQNMLSTLDPHMTDYETTRILAGDLVPHLNLATHLAVLNYQEAIASMREMVEAGARPSERTAFELQRILTHHRSDSTSLCFRDPLEVDDRPYRLAHRPLTVAEQMKVLFSQYEGEWRWLHPVVSSTFLYVELYRIKPFAQDSGALAWLMCSFHLTASGYQPPIMEAEHLEALGPAVQLSYRRGDCHEVVALFNEAVSNGLQLYRQSLGSC